MLMGISMKQPLESSLSTPSPTEVTQLMPNLIRFFFVVVLCLSITCIERLGDGNDGDVMTTMMVLVVMTVMR